MPQNLSIRESGDTNEDRTFRLQIRDAVLAAADEMEHGKQIEGSAFFDEIEKNACVS